MIGIGIDTANRTHGTSRVIKCQEASAFAGSVLVTALGELLAIFRKRLQLRQEDLAERVGVSRVTISSWERGEAVPTADNLGRLAAELGVSPQDLHEAVAADNSTPHPGVVQLARALKVARVAAGLSQIDVAEKVGRTRQSVSSWERADVPTYPGEVMLDRLAELYGLEGGHRAFEAPLVREAPGIEYSAGRRRMAPAVYEVVYGYLDRMRKGGCSEEQINEAERLMTDASYSQLYARSRREKTEDDQIMDIHAAWRFIAEVIERTEGKRL